MNAGILYQGRGRRNFRIRNLSDYRRTAPVL